MTVEHDRTGTGLTIPWLVHRNATEYGALPALSTLEGAEPVTLTWSSLRAEVAALTCGLAGLGLTRGDRVLIMMSARPEHWVADLAAVHLGAVPCAVHPALGTDGLRFLGRHSGARVLVLAGAAELDRWRPVLDDLPALRTVLVLDRAAASEGDPRVRPLSDVIVAGRRRHAVDPGRFPALWRAVSPADPVALVHTAGTTGDPKAVLLSHANVLHQAAALAEAVPAHAPTVSFLPPAHVTKRVLGLYVLVHRAGHVHLCADPGRLVAALREVRPVTFFGTPRVWEKMVAILRAIVGLLPGDQRTAFDRAHALTLRAYRSRVRGTPVDDATAAQVAAVDRTVLRPVRGMLGLDEVAWSGGSSAPLSVDTLDYLAGAGIEVLECWGLTETTGPVTTNTPRQLRPGTAGRPGAGTRVRLARDGEILVRGPLVCLGYLLADGSVAPAADADGWLATGDLGVVDAEGTLTVTGRRSELITTSGGTRVSPEPIEGLLRAHPLVGHVAVVGDRRPYLTALVCLDERAAPGWARAHRLGVTDLAALAAHPAVLAELDAVVATTNDRLDPAARIREHRVLDRPWTPETGELTPALTVRRRVVAARYAGLIDDLYRVAAAERA